MGLRNMIMGSWSWVSAHAYFATKVDGGTNKDLKHNLEFGYPGLKEHRAAVIALAHAGRAELGYY